MPTWVSKSFEGAEKAIASLAAREELKRQQQQELDAMREYDAQQEIDQSQWTPVIPENTIEMPTLAPITSWQPAQTEQQLPSFSMPSVTLPDYQSDYDRTPVIQTTETAVQETKPKDDYNKYLDPLEPFKIDADLPLWAKAIEFVGKPFELIQEYVFNPLLGAVQQGFSKKFLDSNELAIARKEGIASYFPGGQRYKAYKELQYPGKWAVEILPWLIVPPIGWVGGVGKVGTGIAGALAKLGTAGKFAGKVLEMSPAGLTEKASRNVIGGLVNKIKGKTLDNLPEVVAKAKIANLNPVFSKMTDIINNSAKSGAKLQKGLTKEFRIEQSKALDDALNALSENEGAAGLYKAAAALKGKSDKVDFDALAGILSKDEQDTVAKFITDYAKTVKPNEKLGFFGPAFRGWQKMLRGEVPVDSELKQLEKVFGADVINSLIQRTESNLINKVSDVANAPRAILSAFDLSGLLRQGAILTARHPKEALKTFYPMVKSFFSDKNTRFVDDIIRQRPNTALGEDMGLYIAPLPGATAKLSSREEAFMSSFVEKIPILGKAVKASNRAYVSGLNDLRSRVWESTVKSWEKLNPSDADYKGLATLINAASGRGSLPKAFQGASPLFNAMFFSPRLLISRLQFPAMLMSESPLVRKEAARQLVQFLGTGTAILGMAKLAGAGIEADPRSADFGKIKIGNTRLDIWSGYTQWARFVAQLSTAQRKTAGGNITDVNRAEVVQRFLQSKGSPAASLLYDILRGESYMGEEVSLDTANLKRQAWNRLTPLFIQDMIDAIDQEGAAGGMVALPGLFGIGVVTYTSPVQKLREQIAKENYGMTWEEIGKDPKLGFAVQMELERANPKLLAELKKEQEDYNTTITGKSDVNNTYRNQVETIESYFRSQVTLATQEYRDTGDGYTFKEKMLDFASNRRSQYEILNKNPVFKDIVARYDELPTAADMKKLSPQDWARKEYMRLLYSDDMYDQYGNYRFDMAEDMKAYFVQTFGQSMLDYIETYQGIKDSDLPQEYQMFKQAQKILKPYWEVADYIKEKWGERFLNSSRGQALLTKLRKNLRLTNKEIAYYYDMFYNQSKQ